jgi:hypothetical protein
MSFKPLLATELLGGEIAVDDANKPIAWYPLRTTVRVSGEDARTVLVHRRFRDFAALDADLRSHITDARQLSALPALPPKGIKLFTDHTSPEFVETRRVALAAYLAAVAPIAEAGAAARFHEFLGVSEDCCERSVIFREGALGMTLAGQCVGTQVVLLFTEVTGFETGPDGSRGQAALSRQVQPGDKCVAAATSCVDATWGVHAIAVVAPHRRPAAWW